MSALIVGATSGLGRALTRVLAERGDDLVLVARDPTDLEAEASHLRTVYGVTVTTISSDAAAPDAFVATVSGTAADFGDIRSVLLPIGLSRSSDLGAWPLAQTQTLLDVNFTSVATLVEALLPRLIGRDSVIVGFGSIAALRGRSANVVYSAAKRALESYFESLRHRLSTTKVRVQFYRLGYLDTQQSFGKRLLLPKASPERIARAVARNLDRDLGITTRPRFWIVVSSIVRRLPWPLFRRLDF
ncbi:MAG: SDR family NAD(P)-dependent oxidoreductase [Xanthobacteraceae bacterium]